MKNIQFEVKIGNNLHYTQISPSDIIKIKETLNTQIDTTLMSICYETIKELAKKANKEITYKDVDKLTFICIIQNGNEIDLEYEFIINNELKTLSENQLKELLYTKYKLILQKIEQC